MKNYKLYLYSKNLSFFYLINQELTNLKLKFKILSLGVKIPNIPCILITTIEEIEEIKNTLYPKIEILCYDENKDFNQFVIKVLATYRLGYKENYSDLIFSIDPGTKRIGLVIFLDDYYLNSHTIYEKGDLIKKIKDYVEFLEYGNRNTLSLSFKFGRGVLPITLDLVNNIFNVFDNRKEIIIYLIDESKSSKIRIQDNNRNFPKHEASALILSLRNGIEVNRDNFKKIFNEKKLKIEIENLKDDDISTIRKIAKKVLIGELSLSESTQMIKSTKMYNQ